MYFGNPYEEFYHHVHKTRFREIFDEYTMSLYEFSEFQDTINYTRDFLINRVGIELNNVTHGFKNKPDDSLIYASTNDASFLKAYDINEFTKIEPYTGFCDFFMNKTHFKNSSPKNRSIILSDQTIDSRYSNLNPYGHQKKFRENLKQMISEANDIDKYYDLINTSIIDDESIKVVEIINHLSKIVTSVTIALCPLGYAKMAGFTFSSHLGEKEFKSKVWLPYNVFLHAIAYKYYEHYQKLWAERILGNAMRTSMSKTDDGLNFQHILQAYCDEFNCTMMVFP